MGRRNINTTKSGKFMNPTDQARKEARRRELKKNKKQRTAVRHAVLKSKDPEELLKEMEEYDRMEYDPSSSANLTERVVQEKRKKLTETLDRVLSMYRRDEPELAVQLQTKRNAYEARRQQMILHYEQVKLAERVKTSDIPLPDLPPAGLPLGSIGLPPGLPPSLPPPGLAPNKESTSASTVTTTPAKGILKRAAAQPPVPGIGPVLPRSASRAALPDRKPPGPPPGPPPELSDDDDDADEDPELSSSAGKRIRFQDETSSTTTAVAETALLSGEVVIDDADVGYMPPPAGSLPSLSVPHMLRGPPLVPPPPLQGLPLGLPPTAPPSLPPPSGPGGLHIRLPPGPPPPFMGSVQLSAPPNLHSRVDTGGGSSTKNDLVSQPSASKPTLKKGQTTIQAKPQLKNLIGDATKFVPTAIKVRRQVKDMHGKTRLVGGGAQASGTTSGLFSQAVLGGAAPSQSNATTSRLQKQQAASKDDAYDQFMREMEGVL